MLPCGLQVGEHLRQVDGKKGLARLQLDDEAISHHEVDSRLTDQDPFVFEGDRDLSPKWNAAERELHPQGFLVDGFQETRSKDPMDLKSSVHDGARMPIKLLARLQQSGVFGVLAVHISGIGIALPELLAQDGNIPIRGDTSGSRV
jgi:hypothetical protein